MIATIEMLADIFWGSADWMIPVIGVAVVLTALTIWNYSRNRPVGVVGMLAAISKILAIALIAVCLLEPMQNGTRPRPKSNVFPIIVDNSQSMQLKPNDASESRGERAQRLLTSGNTWVDRLEQDFDVRRYSFDSRLKSISSGSFDLPLDGYATSLSASIEALGLRFASRPVGGVLLFTDGNVTDTPTADFDWSKLGFPVYPVLPRRESDIRDVRITDVSVRQTDFESAPMTLRVQVESVAMGSTQLIVQLREIGSGTLIEEQSVVPEASGQPVEVTFRFRPKSSGVLFYRAVVFTEADREAVEATTATSLPRTTTEATLVNNERIITVDRKSGPYRILYVAGRPNWEFKFLRRALSEDAEIQLVGLMRIAKKELKFSFRDQGVSRSNPLFQGLGDDQEEIAEQYDEAVMIRLGVKESEELSDGFPEAADELFAYQAVILDDIESDFFSQDQLLLLREFVGSRGGGLLMLGGQESFAGKAFADSPLGDLSAVYAARGDNESRPGAYRIEITREGMLQPWVRLRDKEEAEQDRLKAMPPFTTLNAVGDPKPGASTLAVVPLAGRKSAPALVTQRFGKGRTAAMPIGDLWRWSMRRRQDQRDDPAQTWRQLAHWLVGDVPRRVEATVKVNPDPSQPADVIVTVRDEGYLPMDNAKVTLKVTPLGGEAFEMIADADDSEAGVYKANYWSKEPQAYRVDATVRAADGSRVGTAATGWTAQPDAAEWKELRIHRERLEQIASDTGGEVVNDDQLDAFVNDLPNRKMPVNETWVYPLWHRGWVMMLAMLCLCSEWGLRRWKGLA
ncbi:glutamine amidotransferase [Novipirellula artificiosorum]|uniref:Putative glutamine amidotransferase domain-containing protein n=1 Tax=Novipirellula artificiosorum TaxID=2528016 RepID=A0A5C6E167_9BACT|nr:glutamine amidotransferase [Novipirellula artificiosorum]TWU41106.1 hypothetical protein Poly41_19440 [Novipirellula artificiosorum]